MDVGNHYRGCRGWLGGRDMTTYDPVSWIFSKHPGTSSEASTVQPKDACELGILARLASGEKVTENGP